MNLPFKNIILAAALLAFSVQPTSVAALSDYGAAGAAATAGQTAAQAAGMAGSVATGKATVALNYKEYVLDTIATAMAKSLMQQITKSTVNWIRTGFQGQPFVPEDYQKWARDTGDKVGGQFVDDLIGQATNGKFSLCQIPGFKLGLSLPRAEPFEIQTKCSLSAGANAWQDTFNKAAAGDWSSWLEISRPENNPYGQFLLSWEEKNRRVTDATTKEQTDLTLNKGTLSLREHSIEADPVCTNNCERQDELTRDGPWYDPTYLEACMQSCVDAGSEKTTTPGAIINDQLTQTLGGGWRRLEAADELNEVIGALVDYALGQVQNGLVTRTGSTHYSSSPSYTSGNLYSTFRKTYTLDDVKSDIFQMKYSLYDGKIISYDSGFKPGQDGSDDEAKGIYQSLYAQLKGTAATYDVNCEPANLDDKMAPLDAIHNPNGPNVFNKGFWDQNCGILAYNTFRDKRPPNTIHPAGFDLVKRSSGLAGPQSQALIWYRKFALKRLEIMFSELIDARTQATGDATKVRCQFIDQRDLDFDTAKDLINQNAGQLKDDINDIEGYYGVNGTYDNLLSLLGDAEKATREINIMDANASTTIQNIAENLLTLKTRMPSLSEKITKRFDDMGFYAKGSSCDGKNFTATSTDGTTYGYGELGCMAKAEKLKYDALATNPNAAFSKTDIQKFNNLPIGADKDANMHCWIQGALFDTYGDWSAADQNTPDTCDGNTNSPYSCGANDNFSCTDVASNIEASATGGSGGGTNSGGSGGSASVGASYSRRDVTCVLGAGVDPNAGSGSSGGAPDAPYQSLGFTFAMCSSDPRITESVHDGYYWSQRECMASFVGHDAAVTHCQLALGADHERDPGYGCGYTSAGQITSCLTQLYANPGMARCPGGTPY